MKFHESGYGLLRTPIARSTVASLQSSLFIAGNAGKRCLLDESLVRSVAEELREALVAAGFLPLGAKAIQAIAFDKTPRSNWKVTWHQDVMFPFAAPVSQSGFDLPSKKEGVDYARPPKEVLEDLLAVRLHVDECNESNGPLRVSPGSHRRGVLRSTEIQECLLRHGEVICVANEGDALLMKPLLLHASSPATAPKHRRVLHFVFHSGRPIPERWYRTV